MNNTKRILELSAKWCNFVSNDHHKDRDCHWYIEIDYAYGSDVRYYVSHNGYIAEDIDGTFNSLEEAEKFLIEKLKDLLNRNNLLEV